MYRCVPSEGSRSLADRPAHAVEAARARALARPSIARAGSKAARRAPDAADATTSSRCRGTMRSTWSPRSCNASAQSTAIARSSAAPTAGRAPGRFHHAQSQVHRFLNSIGGYVRHRIPTAWRGARADAAHRGADGRADGHPHALGQCWPSTASSSSPSAACRQERQINGRRRHPASRARAVSTHARERRALRQRHADRRRSRSGGDVEWLAIRPNTDTALMLALCHTLLVENLYDRDFLDRYTVGFDKFAPSLAGKDAAWAEKITGIPAARIVRWRARWRRRAPWSASAGRCSAPSRRAAVLGAGHARRHAGPDRPAGRRLRRGLRALGQSDGQRTPSSRPDPAARHQCGQRLHSGRAHHRHAAASRRARFAYNGRTSHYPDIRLVYWAGGNPFHHHQDLNRLTPRLAQARDDGRSTSSSGRRRRSMADIVLPATTTWSATTSATAAASPT